jgi:hypothetical protein
MPRDKLTPTKQDIKRGYFTPTLQDANVPSEYYIESGHYEVKDGIVTFRGEFKLLTKEKPPAEG